MNHFFFNLLGFKGQLYQDPHSPSGTEVLLLFYIILTSGWYTKAIWPYL